MIDATLCKLIVVDVLLLYNYESIETLNSKQHCRGLAGRMEVAQPPSTQNVIGDGHGDFSETPVFFRQKILLLSPTNSSFFDVIAKIDAH